ncbi:unnamed protein product, partial [Discosporangium mesarthrocarpum]
QASKWRSRCRIPVLTWLHPSTGAALCRSSQPMTGIGINTACPEDEQLLLEIREAANISGRGAFKGEMQEEGGGGEREEGEEGGFSSSSGGSGVSFGVASAPLSAGELPSQALPLPPPDVAPGAWDARGGGLAAWWAGARKGTGAGAVAGAGAAGAGAGPGHGRQHEARAGAGAAAGGEEVYWGGEEQGVDRKESRQKTVPGGLGLWVTREGEKGMLRIEDSALEAESGAEAGAGAGADHRGAHNTTDLGARGGSVTTAMPGVHGSSPLPPPPPPQAIIPESFSSQAMVEAINTPVAGARAGTRTGVDDDSIKDVTWQSREPRAGREAVLRIVDARPMISAKGNLILGKGHEVISRLGGSRRATLTFLEIPNIHAMRESFNALVTACSSADDEDSSWLQQLHSSRWLEYISYTLRGASDVATRLTEGDPVLVHCSDGWDRTSQLVSLAQVLLDPYYRTIEGFQVLVSKDWCTFGHQFAQRGGHNHNVDIVENSPIFLQFLDATWQLLRQFPSRFEFSEDLLLLLRHAWYSRWYNDFLHDSEYERVLMHASCMAGGGNTTHSVWSHVRHSPEQFRNILWDGGGQG